MLISLFHRLGAVVAVVLALLLSACETTSTSNDPRSAQQMEYRRLSLASEPRGDFYIGRRFHIERTHFWGYVRRPGESWDNAKLVVINEKFQKTPDRLPEMPSGMGAAHGNDNNSEYRLWGYFSGRKAYDPNSNLILPEFVLRRYQLISDSPGWLFKPNERYDGQHLLRSEPGAAPGSR